MNIKTSRYTTLAYCSDCDSEHLAPVPCGLTYAQRLRSLRLGTEWMPYKQQARALGSEKGGRDYYDDEPLKEMFGGASAAERHEELMEETQGVGFADDEDLSKRPELVNAHYLENPSDEL